MKKIHWQAMMTIDNHTNTPTKAKTPEHNVEIMKICDFIPLGTVSRHYYDQN